MLYTAELAGCHLGSRIIKLKLLQGFRVWVGRNASYRSISLTKVYEGFFALRFRHLLRPFSEDSILKRSGLQCFGVGGGLTLVEMKCFRATPTFG